MTKITINSENPLQITKGNFYLATHEDTGIEHCFVCIDSDKEIFSFDLFDLFDIHNYTRWNDDEFYDQFKLNCEVKEIIVVV